MQFSSKLFLAALGALIAVHTATAAPVSNMEVMGRADAEVLTGHMVMVDEFSISDLKNALSKAASVVQKIATTAKPIVDTIAKVASVTPLAPEAALIDTAVNAATKIPVGAAQPASASASAGAKLPSPSLKRPLQVLASQAAKLAI